MKPRPGWETVKFLFIGVMFLCIIGGREQIINYFARCGKKEP